MGSHAQRRWCLGASIVAAGLLTYQIIYSLSVLPATVIPEIYLIRIALSLAGFCFPILGAWFAFRILGGLFFSLFAFVMVLFVGGVSSSPVFAWFLLAYAGLLSLLYQLDQRFENQLALTKVDFEELQNAKNDLTHSYKQKGEGISTHFQKYSTYYNLRRLAEKLSTTLSVAPLSQMVVQRSIEFIARGDVVLISLAGPTGQDLKLSAFGEVREGTTTRREIRRQGTDLFDYWVLKKHQRLIVGDAHQDFRFDLKETSKKTIRSLIMVPLLHEGRVIGTLRINSQEPQTFTNDDLRLLDTISVLASSALSNAMLYEQTEELAIRDSLTGLFFAVTS